jgi:hypothetical protein
LLVRITSAPQTFGTASTSTSASRSMWSPGFVSCRVMVARPSRVTSVHMKTLKLSCTSSGVRPYSRCASAWMSWQLVWASKP